MNGGQTSRKALKTLSDERETRRGERKKKLARMYGEMIPRILANFMVNGAVD